MDRVAYKPLSSGETKIGPADEEDEHDRLGHEEDEDQYLAGQPQHEDGYFYHNSQQYYHKRHPICWLLPGRCCSSLLELKQLRNFLTALAILLTLVFLALLTFRDNATQARSSAANNNRITLPDDDTVANSLPGPPAGGGSTQFQARAAALHMQPPSAIPHLLPPSPSESKPPHSWGPIGSHTNQQHDRPQYDNYMSSIVGIRESNELQADDLHSGVAAIRQVGQSTNKTFTTKNWWALNLRSNYVTVTDYIRANKSFNYNSSLTLTTQATVEFLYHSLELCKRWDGPISLAVFVPGHSPGELQVATSLIKYMRQCLPLPLSACIRDKLTWHLVYPAAHGPAPSELGAPNQYLDRENFPLFAGQDRCPKLAGPDAQDLIRQFEMELRKRNGLFPLNYRQQHRLTYPINVLRNTARLATQTRYLLASDIELYPSIQLVPAFMNYIQRHNVPEEYSSSGRIERFIFTLPIFEVKATRPAPRTKSELVQMLQQGDAIFFHKWVCDACQAFPNRLDWLQTDKFGVDDYHHNEQQRQQDSPELCIFEVTQRDREKNSWEPIFIGTNDDPLYDDRLTWDGRRDKMGQMYEMCLRDYHLLVVGNAFLVHAPGIKHIDRQDVARRYNFMRDNNLIYDATMARLREQYENSSNVDRC